MLLLMLLAPLLAKTPLTEFIKLGTIGSYANMRFGEIGLGGTPMAEDGGGGDIKFVPGI